MIFRPHNVYGERQNLGDRYRNVIGIFMNKVLQGEPMTVYGDGEQTRAFSYIADVAPIIARSIERPDCWGEVINVGADQPYTIAEMAREVASAMGVAPEIVQLEARDEVKHAWTSHEKLERYFGDLRKRVSLPEGLARMAQWARGTGVFDLGRFESIEIRRGLYSFWQDEIERSAMSARQAA